MRSSFSLGRIAGVKVGISWTVLVIVGLITLSLAGGILPAQVDGLSDTQYLIGGVLGAVGLLGSILAHELGHAIVARRNGIKVDSITLWLFGGLAQLEGEIPNPRVEAKVAGVGPAVSMVAGVVGIAGALLLNPSSLPGALLGWLGIVNVVLAVFNLLPGSPLDGGRLLHAFLWHRSGDRHRATLSASKAGRVIGLLLIGVGAIEFLLGSVVGGLWTATIGWILISAAGAEAQHSTVQTGLTGIRARQVADLSEPVPDWLVVDEFVARYVLPSRRSTFLLLGFDGVPSGWVQLADLARVSAEDRLTQPVRRYARPLDAVPTIDVNDPADQLMSSPQASLSPLLAVVTEYGRAVGVITRQDVTRALERAKVIGGLQQPVA